jgi:glycosyltransferase involved in cell wall biosynthesis
VAGVPRFSVVIPAYNEERFLPRLLDSVEVARSTYARGRDAVEVIVADNASTDGTARLARERGCTVVPVERRVIGAARNGGARAARGDVLAFVDADARIHPRTFDAIDQAFATGRVVGGATGVTSERWSLGIVVTWALLLPMVWITGMDTGVTFCRREEFDAIGGYDEGLKFAEDVKLLVALRRLGRARGQHLARLTSVKAVASTRKFDDLGDWHYFRLIGHGLYALLRGRHDEFTDRYWYHPDR